MTTPEYRQPTHREELERELVHGAATHIASEPHHAGAIAEAIKTVLDTLHPASAAPTAALTADLSGFSAEEVSRSKDRIGIVLTKLPAIDPGPDSLEREIQAKADKGPRVTPAALQAEIVSAHFFTAYQGAKAELQSDGVAANAYEEIGMQPLKLLTFCVLVLRNGFTVYGASACASPENFNAEIGRRIARENAEREIWPLLGFRLRDELALAGAADAECRDGQGVGGRLALGNAGG